MPFYLLSFLPLFEQPDLPPTTRSAVTAPTSTSTIDVDANAAPTATYAAPYPPASVKKEKKLGGSRSWEIRKNWKLEEEAEGRKEGRKEGEGWRKEEEGRGRKKERRRERKKISLFNEQWCRGKEKREERRCENLKRQFSRIAWQFSRIAHDNSQLPLGNSRELPGNSWELPNGNSRMRIASGNSNWELPMAIPIENCLAILIECPNGNSHWEFSSNSREFSVLVLENCQWPLRHLQVNHRHLQVNHRHLQLSSCIFHSCLNYKT